MRSRPKVKILLSPPVATPGDELRAEIVLTSKSETPIDYVCLELIGKLRVSLGSGKSRRTHDEYFYKQDWFSQKTTLVPGERRYPVVFRVPPDAYPVYASSIASITHTLCLRVSIPWWPDRVENFVVNVVRPPVDAPSPAPRIFATSEEGPRGTEPFMELALDDTWLTPGSTLGGSISVQNLHGRRIKSLSLALLEWESIALPYAAGVESRRWGIRVLDGAPEEGQAVPFTLRVPREAFAELRTRAFEMMTFIEARASVAWGADVTLRVPVVVAPAGSTVRKKGRWIAPVGRERQALIWQKTAERLGLEHDAEEGCLRAARDGVAIEIASHQRGDGPWGVADLRFESLDLDLAIAERKWTDALAANVVKTGNPKIDDRLAAHAREHAQAAAVVAEIAPALYPFDEARLDDDNATVLRRGSLHTAEKLEPFVKVVLFAASAIARGRTRIKAPILFADDVAAWRMAAEHLAGRLDLGSMTIRGGRLGTDAVTIRSVWSEKGILDGTEILVAIDPPLAKVPDSFLDPSLSPAAREAWNELAKRVAAATIREDAIALRIDGKTPDPMALLPTLELAVKLRRALTGAVATGPFR
jgi:hypothetical protein